MEERSSRRMRTLATLLAHRGRKSNQIARALIIHDGSEPTAPIRSRIQRCKTAYHQLGRTLLQRTAGPYKGLHGLESGSPFGAFSQSASTKSCQRPVSARGQRPTSPVSAASLPCATTLGMGKFRHFRSSLQSGDCGDQCQSQTKSSEPTGRHKSGQPCAFQ